MRFLFENETPDFKPVCAAIARLFGSSHVVTIYDGDSVTLLGRLRGNYCAGTVVSLLGDVVASFAIDYLVIDSEEEPSHREVVAIHIGPPGYWCRSLSELDRYNRWIASLARHYEPDGDGIR